LVFSKIADTLEAHGVHFYNNKYDITGACCALLVIICACILFCYEWELLMNLKINSRHVEVTPAMRTHLEAGLAKIRKHFDHVLDASAFLIVDNAKEKNLRQAAEITIHLKGKDLYAEAHNADLYHAMDAVVDKLERQVVKHKEKIQDHHHDKHFE
jgi:putative sigma-54 modulation protein